MYITMMGGGGEGTELVNPSELSGTDARLKFKVTDQAANLKLWDIEATGTTFNVRTRTDADGAGQTAWAVTRTPTTTVSTQVWTAGTFRFTATTGLGINVTPTTELHVLSTSSSNPRGVISDQITADALGSRYNLRKARGTPGSEAIITTGDVLGRLAAWGYDGAAYLQMGQISFDSTGTVALNRVPTVITFSTATDASPSVLTTAVTINQKQCVGIGTSPTHFLDVVAGTLASTQSALSVTGTFSSTNAAQVGINATFVSAGSGATAPQQGLALTLSAGYTGSAATYGLTFDNQVAGTGADIFSAFNTGSGGRAGATTSGHNSGVRGTAQGGAVNYGTVGIAIVAKNSAVNVGAAGYALNTGSSPTYVGVFAGLMGATPTFANAALLADNGTTAASILTTRSNGTANWSFIDGGEIQPQVSNTYNIGDATHLVGSIFAGTRIYSAQLQNSTTAVNGAIANIAGTGVPIIAIGANTSNFSQMVVSNGNDTTGATIGLMKTRGTDAGGQPSIITTGDVIGQLNFYGADSSSTYATSARIQVISTGTIASTRIPSKMLFQVGTNATPTVVTTVLTLDTDLSASFAGAVSGPSFSFTGASGSIPKYNNVTTAGWGVEAIYGSGRSTAQTGDVASVATYTVGVAEGSFVISANVNVTTATAHSFNVQVAYTDEASTAQTLTLSFSQLAGTTIQAITNVTGTGPYEGVPVHIRAKAATSITVKTAGTFTTVTYNVEGSIRQIA